MDYKRILKFVSIIFFFHLKVFADIAYDKLNNTITEYDINLFQTNYENIFKLKLNNQQALKQIILVNNLINKLEKNNLDYLNIVDNFLYNQNYHNLSNNTYKNLLRYTYIKNDLIKNYFETKISQKEIQMIINSIENLNVSLSLNGCFTVDKIMKISEINNFDKYFYEAIKNRSNKTFVNINNNKYEICENKNYQYEVESSLIKFIDKKTNIDLLKLMYDKS